MNLRVLTNVINPKLINPKRLTVTSLNVLEKLSADDLAFKPNRLPDSANLIGESIISFRQGFEQSLLRRQRTALSRDMLFREWSLRLVLQ
jgi:hypothetical protein